MTRDDIRLFDNGKRQRGIVAFERDTALPIRAGLLFDISPSVDEFFVENRFIAGLYASKFLNKGTDRAFVTRFDSDDKVLQGWTADASLLGVALRRVDADTASRLSGTALFDALYKACRDQFAPERSLTGNFILLFTDGDDNSSHTRIDDVLGKCQETRTAIYAFTGQTRSRFARGQKVLRELTSQSGGRLFFSTSRETVAADVAQMTAEQRTQYRLVYKPTHLRHDNSFHKLKVELPLPPDLVTAPAGYYAAP